MRVTGYSAAGYVCSVSKYKRHLEKPGRVLCGYVVWCYVCCYGCCASQERRHVSAVPRLLAFSSILLACARPTMGSGNSARSQTHQDNWHCEQDQQYSTRPERKRGLLNSIHRIVNVWQYVCVIRYMIMWGPTHPKTEVALTASPGLDLLSTDHEVGKFCLCVFNMQNCTLLFPVHLASSLLTTRAWLPLCIIAILVQAPHLRLFSRQPS